MILQELINILTDKGIVDSVCRGGLVWGGGTTAIQKKSEIATGRQGGSL